ncbi:hypothetical protein ACT29H_11245 [Thermophagus sp. OGC60D27]|uniref:hypothetical protein n=1 Tax=Thermophagus sp. OGC60D27 TaxID=3458415 RepID=UPI004037DA87
MKRKFWFTLTALLLFVVATPTMYAVENDHTLYSATQQDEVTFNEIEISEVPEAVLEAVKKEHPETPVTKAKVAEVDGKKVYKLVLGNEGDEKVIALYNSDGTTYTPNS